MADPRLQPLPEGIPDRLGGAASVHLWRRYALEAGLPLALDEAFAPHPWVDDWLVVLEEVDAWRVAETERDALDVRSSLVAGTVPRAVWIGLFGGWALFMSLLGIAWGTLAAFAGFMVPSVGGLGVYAWNERVRKRRLAAARRAHAIHRAEVDRRVRALFAEPIDVVIGDVRYLMKAGASRSAAPPVR